MPYERNLWERLREQSKHLLASKRLHLCRVENTVLPGYPDVEGCLDGKSFHIELKGALRPAGQETPIRVKWQPGQKPWLNRRWSVGGACFLLLRVGRGREIRLYMIRGDQVNEVGEVPESKLDELSLIHHDADGDEILNCAAKIREVL